MNNIVFSSKSDEWITPDYFYNDLNSRFLFDLDPCSTSENHKCDYYFTKNDNGLLRSWKNHRVFCNPPYSDIKRWVEKCFNEHFFYNTDIVLLIPSRTDTNFFHSYIYGYADIFFIKGRLKFSNSKNNCPFPVMLAKFGFGGVSW